MNITRTGMYYSRDNRRAVVIEINDSKVIGKILSYDQCRMIPMEWDIEGMADEKFGPWNDLVEYLNDKTNLSEYVQSSRKQMGEW